MAARPEPEDVLVATAPGAYPRLFAALPGLRLALVTNMRDATRALNDSAFDLIMIGVHFDESQMFELLHHVRSDERHRTTPVICFRGVDLPHTRHSADPEPACKAAGAAAFFDLTTFPDTGEGNLAVREIVTGVLRRSQRTEP